MSDLNHNTPGLWLSAFPFPKRDGHKYDRGHALIYGGGVMTGATRLAARAAQRMGAGVVTLATDREAIPIYSELESAIVRPADDIKAWRELLADPKRNAILIGPGLGTGVLQTELVLAALETKKLCVLDADALNDFSGKADVLFAKLHDKCVMTPHEKEFIRLFGNRVETGAPKADRARKAAQIAKCTVLLKGADTIIASPDGKTVHNNNAPPWLATAGSGDVLAGMVLGLIAQAMPVPLAAAASAWIHGKIASDFGHGLIAEDLISGIPAALKALSVAAGIV